MAKCEWCLTPAKSNELECDNCGGSVNISQPWVIQCGWCGSSNRRDEALECRNCEGELPQIPGTHRPPKPTPAPRTITTGYKARVWLTKNVSMLIGIPFLGIGIFSFASLAFMPTMVSSFMIIFPLVGVFLIINGSKKAKRKLTALQFGSPTEGSIINVRYDRTQSINNKHPILIEYTFNVNGKEHQDKTEVWDTINLERQPGEEIWVVYDRQNIKSNNIWPPLK